MNRSRFSCVVALVLALAGPTISGAPALHASPAPALPADTLRGVVSDPEGTPLAGVEVEFVELGRHVFTDAVGSFLLAGVPAGEYTVVFERVGYAPAVRRIRAAEGVLDVALRPSPFELEPVTVTLTRAPVGVLSSPLPTAALSGSELRREPSISLAHALNNLAGVRTLSTGEQIGKPVIRGLTGSRVLVLDNAHRLEDYSWSSEDGPSVDARLAERVEVIRGPASVLYGSDALGGVINVVPRDVPDALGKSPFVRAGIEAYGASNNRELASVLRLEGARNALGWRVVAIGRRAGDFRTPEGELPNTGFEAINGEAALGLRGTWGSGTLRYARYGGEFRLLEADFPPGEDRGEQEEEGPERKLSDDRLQFTGNFPVGGVRLETRAQWQRHWLAELADEPGFGGTPGKEEIQFDLLLNTYTADLLAHHSLGGRTEGVLGGSAAYQDNDSRGRIPLVPDARTRSGALFALERVRFGRWSLLAGARADLRHLDVDAMPALMLSRSDTRDHAAVTANVGAVYEPVPGLALRGNVGRAWRAPTLFELYTDGPFPAEARYEIGRADLEPETSLNLDLGVDWERGSFRGEVATYRNRIENYIFLAPTNEFRDGYRVFRHQQAAALLWGGEASLEWEPWRPLLLRSRLDYVHGTNLDADEPLPLIPPARADFEAELGSTQLAWAERAYLSVESELFAKQTRLNPFDVPTAGYGLLHLGAGLQRHLAHRPWALDLRVRNVADKAYRNFLSRYKEFALNPGRSVLIRVSTEL